MIITLFLLLLYYLISDIFIQFEYAYLGTGELFEEIRSRVCFLSILYSFPFQSCPLHL